MVTNQLKFRSRFQINLLTKNVRLQLSHNDFFILFALCADATSQPPSPHDMYEKLVHSLLTRVFKKLSASCTVNKQVYYAWLSPEECIAFWIYWTDHEYPTSTRAGKLLNDLNDVILLAFSDD